MDLCLLQTAVLSEVCLATTELPLKRINFKKMVAVCVLFFLTAEEDLTLLRAILTLWAYSNIYFTWSRHQKHDHYSCFYNFCFYNLNCYLNFSYVIIPFFRYYRRSRKNLKTWHKIPPVTDAEGLIQISKRTQKILKINLDAIHQFISISLVKEISVF